MELHKSYKEYCQINMIVASINDTNRVEAFEYFSNPDNHKLKTFARLCNDYDVFDITETIEKLGPEFVYNRFKLNMTIDEECMIALYPYLQKNLTFEFFQNGESISSWEFDMLAEKFGIENTIKSLPKSCHLPLHTSYYADSLLRKAGGVDRQILQRMYTAFTYDSIPMFWREYIKKDIYTSFDELSMSSPHNVAVLLCNDNVFSIKDLAQHFGIDYVVERIPQEVASKNKVVQQILSLDGITFEQAIKFFPATQSQITPFWKDFISQHNTEFFEYLAVERPRTLTNLLAKSTTLDPQTIITNFGVEKTIEILPKISYNKLPQAWVENIFSDKNFKLGTLQKMIDNMGDEVLDLSKPLQGKILQNDAYKNILIRRVINLVTQKNSEGKDNENLSEILQTISQNPKVFDKLPAYIARNPEVQDAFGRHRQTQTINNPQAKKLAEDIDDDWRNEDGKLVQFFKLYSDFPIKSKEDYLKVYEAYKKSKMSAEQFCTVYKIEPSSGFQLMLDAISLESYTEHVAITEGKYDVQRRYVGSFVSGAHKVAAGTMTMEEFLNAPTAYNYSLRMVNSLLGEKPAIKNAFVKSMIDYFATRDPKTMTEKEIAFIGGEAKDLSNTFFSTAKPELIFPQDKDYAFKLQSARSHIKLCEKGYSRLLISGTSYFANGKNYPVTDSAIDQALAYADDHGIYRCNYTISQISKDIATGKLDYSAQTSETMQDMRDALKDLLQEKSNVEEYLQIMEAGQQK